MRNMYNYVVSDQSPIIITAHSVEDASRNGQVIILFQCDCTAVRSQNGWPQSVNISFKNSIISDYTSPFSAFFNYQEADLLWQTNKLYQKILVFQIESLKNLISIPHAQMLQFGWAPFMSERFGIFMPYIYFKHSCSKPFTYTLVTSSSASLTGRTEFDEWYFEHEVYASVLLCCFFQFRKRTFRIVVEVRRKNRYPT